MALVPTDDDDPNEQVRGHFVLPFLQPAPWHGMDPGRMIHYGEHRTFTSVVPRKDLFKDALSPRIGHNRWFQVQVQEHGRSFSRGFVPDDFIKFNWPIGAIWAPDADWDKQENAANAPGPIAQLTADSGNCRVLRHIKVDQGFDWLYVRLIGTTIEGWVSDEWGMFEDYPEGLTFRTWTQYDNNFLPPGRTPANATFTKAFTTGTVLARYIEDDIVWLRVNFDKSDVEGRIPLGVTMIDWPVGRHFFCLHGFDNPSTRSGPPPGPVLGLKKGAYGVVIDKETIGGVNWVQVRGSYGKGWVPLKNIAINFPNNRPFRVIKDTDISGTDIYPPGPSLRLLPGTEGIIRSTVRIHSQSWCEVITVKTRETGWVLIDRLDVSRHNEVGDLQFVDDIPRAFKLSHDLNIGSEGSLIERVTMGFLQALHKARNPLKMHYVSESFWSNTRTSAQQTQIAREISRACDRAGSRDIFENPEYTIIDLVDTCPQVKKNTTSGGIYLRRIVQSDGRTPDHFYVGQSRNLGERFRSYLYKSRRPDDPFYKTKHGTLTRNAKSVDMVILAYVDKQQFDSILDLLEQLFIVLLDSYASWVTDHNSNVPVDAADSVSAQDAQQIGDGDPSEVVGKWAGDIVAARALCRVAREVMTLINFPRGAIGRSPKQEDFGADFGLNIKSPLREYGAYGRIIWTRTKKGNVINFRRPPVKALKNGNSVNVVNLGSGFSRIMMTVRDSPVPLGTDVHTTMEIMADGSRHPYPYANIPTVGPFTDWDRANALGVRVEWQGSDGQWARAYVQNDHFLFVDQSLAGSLRQYVNAKAIMNYLLQYKMENPRPFELDLGIARVKDVSFDFYRQRVTIKDHVGTDEEINLDKRPARKDLDRIKAEIASHGFKRVGEWGTVGQRKSCDGCFLNYPHSQSKHCARLVLNGVEQDMCQRCALLGRTCSWTDTRWLEAQKANNTEAFKALSFGAIGPEGIKQDIEAPELLSGLSIGEPDDL